MATRVCASDTPGQPVNEDNEPFYVVIEMIAHLALLDLTRHWDHA